METRVTISEEKLKEIQLDAVEFANMNISSDISEMWGIVYDLKRSLLQCGETINIMNREFTKEIKDKQKAHDKRIQHALDAQSEMSEAYETRIKELEKQNKELRTIIQNRAK